MQMPPRNKAPNDSGERWAGITINDGTALAARPFHLKLDGDFIGAPIEAALLPFVPWRGELLECTVPPLRG